MSKSCKVYIFLADGFEEVEGLTVVDLLRRAGADLAMVSITGRKEVTGSHGIQVMADRLFEDGLDQADLLVLPGGMPGTRHLGDHRGLADLLTGQYEEGKRIAAICAAPSVFGGLGFLKDRRATSYPGSLEGLPVGRYLEEEVVVDGNVTTSRGAGTAIPFALSLIRQLYGPDKADEIGKSIIFGL